MSTVEERLSVLETKLDRVLDGMSNGRATHGHAGVLSSVVQEVDSAVVSAHGEQTLRESIAEVLYALSDPEALASLGRIAQLLPRIEYALHALGAGPELLDEGMELVRERTEGDATVNARLERARDLLVSFSDLSTLDALQRITPSLAGLSPVAEATARAGVARTKIEGHDAFTARLSDAVAELTDPDTLESLVRLAQLAPRLEYAAHFAAAGPELLEEAADLLREKLPEDGAMTQARIQALLEFGESVTEPAMLEALNGLTSVVPVLAAAVERLRPALSDPGIHRALQDALEMLPELVATFHALPTHPTTLDVLSALNGAVQSASGGSDRLGAFGLFRALSDRDVQRAMGFGIEVARVLGAHLEKQSSAKQLPSR